MARKSKKKSGLSKNAVSGAALTGLAGGVLGKAVERLLAGEIEDYLSSLFKKKKHHHDRAPRDLAASILTLLSERGVLKLSEVRSGTSAPLSDVLPSLRDLRKFNLVDFDREGGRVTLTKLGKETAAEATTEVTADQKRDEKSAKQIEGAAENE
jgi:hypothetical protein